MEFISITIDVDVYKWIESNRDSFSETHNNILRKIIGLEEISEDEQILNKEPLLVNQQTNEGLICKGVILKNGLKLRKRYRGKEYTAEVKNNQIQYNGKPYYSPSAVAMEISGINVNGWVFWEYFDDENNTWRILNELRIKKI